MSAAISPGGELEQFQVGVQDVAATVSLATTVWQWSGGAKAIQNMLLHLPNLISTTAPAKLGFELKDFPLTCALLTPHGFFPSRSGSSKPRFEDDPRIQLVCFTLCALSHLFDGEPAICLFMRCLAPVLLNDSSHGIKEAFAAQLIDNERRILTEGTTCGLSTRFDEGIANLNLPHGADQQRSPRSELPFVGGLLKWLVQKRRTRYVTRSATVARVAACLQEAGWIIGPIRTWSDPDHPPRFFDGVTLVLAGSGETDDLALLNDDNDLIAMQETGRYVHHYRNETVGSMLYVAMAGPSDLYPEMLQTEFSDVHESIRDRLTFTWDVVRRDEERLGPELFARLNWRTERTQSRAHKLSRLASLLFGPKTSEKVAACFRPLETQLQAILDHDASKSKEVPLAVKRLNAITVCILISISELLGGNSYPSLRHSTKLDLSNPVDYEQRSALSCLSGIISCLDDGLRMCQVVELLSIFHGGMDFSLLSSGVSDYTCIGFQRETYTVLPTLLYNMQPNAESLGFTCGNTFLASITASRDGRVYTSPSDSWSSVAVNIPEGVSDTLVACNSPFIAPPRSAPPDAALYLTFERPYNFYEPLGRNLLLAGRIGGELTGNVQHLRCPDDSGFQSP